MLVDGILFPCGCFGKTQMEVMDGERCECLLPLLLRH